MLIFDMNNNAPQYDKPIVFHLCVFKVQRFVYCFIAQVFFCFAPSVGHGMGIVGEFVSIRICIPTVLRSSTRPSTHFITQRPFA